MIWDGCEGDFLDESFGNKEDLDRFKIPISGFSQDLFLSTNPPFEYDIDEVGKCYEHIALKGVKVFLKFSRNRFTFIVLF